MLVSELLEQLDGLLDERVGAGRVARTAGVSLRRAIHGKITDARRRARARGAIRKAAGAARPQFSARTATKLQPSHGSTAQRPEVKAAGARLRAAKRGGRRLIFK